MSHQILTGFTYTFHYHFTDELGAPTAVDNPVVNFYTPQKTEYYSQVALTATSTVGDYQRDFFAPVGLTIGSWFSLGIGITQSSTIFSEAVPFEVMDITLEPFWLGFEEFRTFLELADDDHDSDHKLKQALAAAIELVEGYTHRVYGIRAVEEIIEIKDTDRVTLKKFPVNTITGITATYRTIPRDVSQNILIETFTGSNAPFHYRLDYENGVMKLLDGAGFDSNYDGVLLGISYLAGFASVPEPVRQAVLSLAAKINALSCTEGISAMRFADVSFSVDKGLFDGNVGDMLDPYMNNFQV